MADDDASLMLHTDTPWVAVQGRQYELFGFDLGEGIPRRKMAVAAIITVPWVVMMLIVGVPLLSKFGVALYIPPPVLGTFFATREDQGGRPQYVLWWDWLRFQIRRGRPLIPRVHPATPVQRMTTTAHMQVMDLNTTTKGRHK